jgi:hypothetical protein
MVLPVSEIEKLYINAPFATAVTIELKNGLVRIVSLVGTEKAKVAQKKKRKKKKNSDFK